MNVVPISSPYSLLTTNKMLAEVRAYTRCINAEITTETKVCRPVFTNPGGSTGLRD